MAGIAMCKSTASDRTLPKLRLKAYRRVTKLVVKITKLGLVEHELQTGLGSVASERE